jgi:TonB family protein
MPNYATASFAVLGLLLAPALARAGEEPAVEGEGRALPYLRALHTKVHHIWADSFLAMATTQLPKDHPINQASRATELELVLTSEGSLVDVKVAKASGSSEFDSSAVDVVKAAAPFVLAPEDVLSDDGKVRVRWTLARDDRRCSGMTVQSKLSTVDVAAPLLVAQGREATAISRLQAASEDERVASFSAFARAWLDRDENDKDLALRVAAANASAGDERGAERLRKTIEKGTDLDLAARGLAALKLPLCPFVKDQLDVTESRPLALSVLRYGADDDCVSWMAGIAKQAQASQAQRLLAIEGLAGRKETVAQAALQELLKDKSPAIQAAAILAQAHPGAGKGSVFRLTPLLRDRSLEVRAAAAAALVRVGGEEVLPQLFLLFKEKDVRPYQAVAKELASLSGEASAEMLARFLRKEDRRIRLAGALALARRHDPAAAKVQATLAASPDAELRFLAGNTLDTEKRAAIAAAPEGYAWTDACTALAQGNGKLAAVDWILAQFPKLDPLTRTDLMGLWLAAAHAKH